MADNNATLLIMKGYHGEFEIFDESDWEQIEANPPDRLEELIRQR